MRIGYPCLNYSIGCTSSSTFRLKNYSPDNLVSKVKSNLLCLEKILKYNLNKGMLFFRITSDLVPFASHPVCTFNWQEYFRQDFKKIGKYIKKHKMRVSMHPDQFVVINSTDKRVVRNSIRELAYHARVLDLMELPLQAKIQIHTGGVYSDKKKSMNRFVQEYNNLSQDIRNRLVVENDDRSYTAQDCLQISAVAGIPVVYDTLHQTLNGNGVGHSRIIKEVSHTWKKMDGIPILDYSSQLSGGRPGRHVKSIDITDFKKFLKATESYDFDIMLEIKDKEKSAAKALKAAAGDRRLKGLS